MQRAVEIYAIVNFAILGLSHALRPRAWIAFFAVLRSHGEAGVFVIAILNLIFGSIIVAFHNVWHGVPLLLTVIGWANVLKALVYLTFPAIGLRTLNDLTPARSRRVSAAGVGFLLVAGVLGYELWARWE